MDQIPPVISDIVRVLDMSKGAAICLFNSEFATGADYHLVVTASNAVHCRALVDMVEKRVSEMIREDSEGFKSTFSFPKSSGRADSGWVIVDMGLVIVHVMSEAARDFYDLDQFFAETAVVFHY